MGKRGPVAKPKKPKEKKPLGRKPHAPTKEQRDQVEAMSAVGIPQKSIALVLDIHIETLEKYYRAELDKAAIVANAKIGGQLYKKAMSGDVTSIIFWLKCRMKWKETSIHELTGEDGGALAVKIIDDV